MCSHLILSPDFFFEEPGSFKIDLICEKFCNTVIDYLENPLTRFNVERFINENYNRFDFVFEILINSKNGKKKFMDYQYLGTICYQISTMIYCRLREGYFRDNRSLFKDREFIYVVIILIFIKNIEIETGIKCDFIYEKLNPVNYNQLISFCDLFLERLNYGYLLRGNLYFKEVRKYYYASLQDCGDLMDESTLNKRSRQRSGAMCEFPKDEKIFGITFFRNMDESDLFSFKYL